VDGSNVEVNSRSRVGKERQVFIKEVFRRYEVIVVVV